jgi:hypothetical protein
MRLRRSIKPTQANRPLGPVCPSFRPKAAITGDNMTNITNESIRKAREFLDYNIGEGVYDADQFIGWSEENLVAFAQKEMDKADNYKEE